VRLEREIFVRGLHEIALGDTPHLGGEIRLRRPRRGAELHAVQQVEYQLLGAGDVLDHRRAEHHIVVPVGERKPRRAIEANRIEPEGLGGRFEHRRVDVGNRDIVAEGHDLGHIAAAPAAEIEDPVGGRRLQPLDEKPPAADPATRARPYRDMADEIAQPPQQPRFRRRHGPARRTEHRQFIVAASGNHSAIPWP
jgi:hypothetical protein